MKAFIVGGSGLVGSNYMTYFSSQGIQCVGTHRYNETGNTVYFDALDLDNPMNFDIRAYRPDVIIHTAAQPNVELCETNEADSYELNVVTARNMALLSRDIGAKLLFTSTDYVFDGEHGPYRETDTVRPLSVYARHKVECEQVIQTLYDNVLILRIGSVYGDEERGKNFIIRIINDVESGREWTMRLPIDQYSTPVNAYDVARCSLLLINDDKRGIYHLGSTDYLNRVQLAHRVLAYLSDHKCSIIAQNTSDLSQKAGRPLRGGLSAHKFLSEYPSFQFTNVDDYMKSKGYSIA